MRLQGFHSARPGASRGLALLLHGWEGSVESSYMLHTAACLIESGFEVFRLNFRDHGETHHANPDIFHSCRLSEVVDAALLVQRMFAADRLVAAGYSLGGNFALRLARAAPEAGLNLAHVAAVCPVLDPAAGMTALERAPWFYRWYFMLKWRRSLRRKRTLFPDRHDFDDAVLAQDMRALTGWLVRQQTDFGSLENYFSAYALAEGGLSGLSVPISVLSAADDPVIPVAAFHRLRLPDSAYLEIADSGGHCGFLLGADLSGYAERWVAERLSAAVFRSRADTLVAPISGSG